MTEEEEKRKEKEQEQELVVVEEEQEHEEEESQQYKFTKEEPIEVEEIALIGEGEELDAIVKKIKVGRVIDFIDIERIRDPNKKDYYAQRALRPAIYIEFEVPRLGIVANDIIVFSLHPNSRYIKLRRRYNVIRKGDAIKVVNENGRLKVV